MKRLACSVLALFTLCASAAFVGSFAGCAQFGVPTPKSFPEAAAAAQVTVTAVRQSALTMLNSGTINVKQAKAARDAADAGNQAIDLAVDVYVAACPSAVAPAASAPPAPPCTVPTANARLNAAVAVLAAAQTLLNKYAAEKH